MLFDNDNVPLKTKRNIITFLVMILTAFFGVRWATGTDWAMYIDYFQQAGWDNIFSLWRGYGDQTLEPGFVLMNVIPKTIYNDYTFYLLVSNLMRFVLLAFVSLRLSRYPIVTFMFLVTAVMLFPTRIPYAYAIFIFGYIFIIERNLKGFLVTWALASLIHTSCGLVFPAYFLYGKRIPAAVQIIVYVISIVFAAQITGLIAELVPTILNDAETDEAMVVDFADKAMTYTQVATGAMGQKSTISYVVEFVTLIMAHFVRFNIKGQITKEEEKDFDFFICFYFISLVLKNLFSDNLYHFQRYKNYFDSLPFIVPFFLVYFKKMRIFVMIIFIAFLYYRLDKQIFNSTWVELFIPYRTYWNLNGF
jgi:hypothetical protein